MRIKQGEIFKEIKNPTIFEITSMTDNDLVVRLNQYNTLYNLLTGNIRRKWAENVLNKFKDELMGRGYNLKFKEGGYITVKDEQEINIARRDKEEKDRKEKEKQQLVSAIRRADIESLSVERLRELNAYLKALGL